MSARASGSQIHASYQFLGTRLGDGDVDITPEQSVREFRPYQQELERFLRETEPAVGQSDRTESRPLDVDRVMERVQQRLQTQCRSG